MNCTHIRYYGTPVDLQFWKLAHNCQLIHNIVLIYSCNMYIMVLYKFSGQLNFFLIFNKFLLFVCMFLKLIIPFWAKIFFLLEEKNVSLYNQPNPKGVEKSCKIHLIRLWIKMTSSYTTLKYVF